MYSSTKFDSVQKEYSIILTVGKIAFSRTNMLFSLTLREPLLGSYFWLVTMVAKGNEKRKFVLLKPIVPTGSIVSPSSTNE